MTTAYWEQRYRLGGFSGAGSRGAEAREKVALVNEVVGVNRVQTLLDLGCGDGHVAGRLKVAGYTGYDPSSAAVEIAREERPSGDFITRLPPEGARFDLVLSMDVIFHLVNEADYQAYLKALFSYGDLVLVYGTDKVLVGRSHVRHREWTKDIPPGWSRRELPTTFKRAWLLRRDR